MTFSSAVNLTVSVHQTKDTVESWETIAAKVTNVARMLTVIQKLQIQW